MASAWVDQTIATERLALRRPTPADAPRVAELVGDRSVSRNLVRVPYPYRLEDAEAFLGAVEDALDPGRHFAVEHGEHGLIGFLGFHKEPSDPLCEIGYWFGRPYWGRGYASEAAAAALAWARDGWGKRALVSGHFADNPASGRVLEKTGFLYTGAREHRSSPARGEAVETRLMVWLA